MKQLQSYTKPTLREHDSIIFESLMITESNPDDNTTGQQGITEGDVKSRESWDDGLW